MQTFDMIPRIFELMDYAKQGSDFAKDPEFAVNELLIAPVRQMLMIPVVVLGLGIIASALIYLSSGWIFFKLFMWFLAPFFAVWLLLYYKLHQTISRIQKRAVESARKAKQRVVEVTAEWMEKE